MLLFQIISLKHFVSSCDQRCVQPFVTTQRPKQQINICPENQNSALWVHTMGPHCGFSLVTVGPHWSLWVDIVGGSSLDYHWSLKVDTEASLWADMGHRWSLWGIFVGQHCGSTLVSEGRHREASLWVDIVGSSLVTVGHHRGSSLQELIIFCWTDHDLNL